MITLYCLKENKSNIVPSNGFDVTVVNNINSVTDLIGILQSATTPYVAIGDSDAVFDKSVIVDAVTVLKRSRHAKALTAGAQGQPVGLATRQLIVPEPINGLVVYSRNDVYFVDAKQADPYDWVSSFRLKAQNSLIVSPLFYKRVRLAASDIVEEEPIQESAPTQTDDVVTAVKETPDPKVHVNPVDPSLPSAANTIFVSVAAYPDPVEKTSRFLRSARKFNVPIRFLSWGEPWHGFVYHKFHEFMSRIKQWRHEGFRYAYVLDSFDVVFTALPEVCCEKAAKYFPLDKLIFNREYPNRTFPYNEEWFRKLVETEGCHLNAGAVFGSFEAFEQVIPLALMIQKEMLELSTSAGVLTTLMQDKKIQDNLKRYVNDDQLLYQLTSLYYPQYFEADTEKRAMAWIASVEDNTLHELRHLHYSVKLSVNEASIIHSSGSARRIDWTTWCQKEGLLVD